MKTVLVNAERCIGCKQCEFACAVEHSQSKDMFQASFESPMPKSRMHVKSGLHSNTSFPNKCRHCEPAPCMIVCPTSALNRQQSDFVLVDSDKCISCAMCAMVCPFDVITFHPSNQTELQKAVSIKCDNCVDRQKQGQIPACVEACKVKALEFGDINELIAKNQSQLAQKLSFAKNVIPTEEISLPDLFKAWRQWGENVSRINQR